MTTARNCIIVINVISITVIGTISVVILLLLLTTTFLHTLHLIGILYFCDIIKTGDGKKAPRFAKRLQKFSFVWMCVLPVTKFAIYRQANFFGEKTTMMINWIVGPSKTIIDGYKNHLRENSESRISITCRVKYQTIITIKINQAFKIYRTHTISAISFLSAYKKYISKLICHNWCMLKLNEPCAKGL